MGLGLVIARCPFIRIYHDPSIQRMGEEEEEEQQQQGEEESLIYKSPPF